MQGSRFRHGAPLDYGDYFATHDREDVTAIIRDFHNEFSGLFIRKYADLFEIPSEAHLFAIVQIARGHRRAVLTDESQYLLALAVPGGNTLCLPYLAALIRLADEVDVAAARNPLLLYDLESIMDSSQRTEHKKARAVRELVVTEDAFTMLVDTDEEEVLQRLQALAAKMQKTLDECREAVLGRTPYVITQRRVVLRRL